jgi:cobalt-zinc-cadmium efflux system outer membrane protein
MKLSYALILASILFLSSFSLTRAQEAPPPGQPVKLADLLAEAERSNPQIQSARHGWDSAKQVPTQVSTLPDP